MRSCICKYNVFQKVLNDNEHQNTVVSSFLVKLLLSILAEAAGLDTITRRELLTVLPSIRTEEETRELYGRTFGSLLASHIDKYKSKVSNIAFNFYELIYS